MKTKTLAVVILLSMVVACSQTPQELLLGKWLSKDGTMEFLKDGSMYFKDDGVPSGIDSVRANWSMLSDNSIEMEFSGNGQTKKYISTISFPEKGKLDMTNEDGDILHLTRISESNKSDDKKPKEKKLPFPEKLFRKGTW